MEEKIVYDWILSLGNKEINMALICLHSNLAICEYYQ